MTYERLVCVLCGATGRDVRMRTVAWKDGGFDNVPRCDKTEECRARVIAQGDEWLAREPAGGKP